METIFINGMAFALPLFVIAIGGIYSERSGITNLALEGMQGAGAFLGALLVVLIGGDFALSQTAMYVAMLAAMVGGALCATLHGLLCVKFRANQVISGVVFNILAMALTGFFTSQVNAALTGKPSNKLLLVVSNRYDLPGLSEIPLIGGLFKQMYPFELIIIVVAFIAWYVLYRTTYGLRLRACGDNPHAVDAAGANVARIRFSAVMISGALSGLGGMCFAYSISANFSSSIYAGFGYLSIAALIFGNWKILPTFGACLLFGFARSGGYRLAQVLEWNSAFSDLMMILPYLVTLLLLIFFSKANRAPRALGEIYDKGKR